MRTIIVRAREEVDDEFGTTVANELELDGYLADNNTLKASRLYICQENETILDFDPDDATELTFKNSNQSQIHYPISKKGCLEVILSSPLGFHLLSSLLGSYFSKHQSFCFSP